MGTTRENVGEVTGFPDNLFMGGRKRSQQKPRKRFRRNWMIIAHGCAALKRTDFKPYRGTLLGRDATPLMVHV